MPGFVGHERRDELSRGRHGEVDAERERHVERVDECNQRRSLFNFCYTLCLERLDCDDYIPNCVIMF